MKATAGVCVGGVIILQLIESGSNLSKKVVVMLLKRLLRSVEKEQARSPDWKNRKNVPK